jgi:hypothetical protein
MHRLLWIVLLTALIGAAKAGAPKPLPHAHSHNDYEHKRPLLDALDQGFCNVEADVHLIQGTLLVGHNPLELRPDRTLQSLYLDPLRQRIQQNGGRVYPDGPTVTLLIDAKSDAASTYTAIKKALEPYHDMLTVFKGDTVEPGAITVIISGNRDRKSMAAEQLRYAAVDGRLQDLDANPPPPASLVPWVSAAWTGVFKWRGTGPISPEDTAKLKTLVQKAHAQHRLLRFWETPDNPTAWKLLSNAGVDLINTDNLPGLAQFMNP